MKTTVKSIELRDFKGIENELIEFLPGENLIEKPNKTGKTTIYDAFCWVVFSKNSSQNSRFQIEPYGKENPQTKVTIKLDVDGTEIILSKGIGKWGYNGLEVKKNVFEDFVSNIYNIETLEFLANPHAFMGLHWETRRNYLTSLFCAKVSEDSEFSFLMKSMSISDIRKSKTQQKKAATDGLKKCGIIIETHEKGIEEISKVDFLSLKKEVESKSKELEKLSNFDWSNFYSLQINFENSKKEYTSLVAQYKDLELKFTTERDFKYEDSKGCSQCGTKLDKKVFEDLKTAKLQKISTDIELSKATIIKKRDSNAKLKTEFEALQATRPDETIPAIISELKKGIDFLNIQISKENDIIALKSKIEAEQKQLDKFTVEVMDIEKFMDRFNSFLVDNYYSSINENFEGLFFDIENECKCTNDAGVEYKDFSTSEKINAGVQIVSVLSKKIGLQFPIWIDDRESVTDLFPIDTQIINLKVKG